MTNYAEDLNDLFDDIEQQIKKERQDRQGDPASTFNIEPAADVKRFAIVEDSDSDDQRSVHKKTKGDKTSAKTAEKRKNSKKYPFGIQITSTTMHTADNIKVFTLMSLSLWELIPPDDREEFRKIRVVQDMSRMMTGQIMIPWYHRKKRHVADWLVDIQLSGGYSCHVATNTYRTHADHEILAITLLVRRISAKDNDPGGDKMEAITGTMVFIMNDTTEEDEESDKFLRDFLKAAGAGKDITEVPPGVDPEKPRSDAVTPYAPNSTEVLDRDGTFLNFFFEIAVISYEVEARSLGDVQ